MLDEHLSALLAGIAVMLVTTEASYRSTVGAALGLVASGLLGVLTLDIDPGGFVEAGGMLAPLFAGLFGAPVLLAAIEGEGVPPQADARITSPRRLVVSLALVGTLCGAAVGYPPGVSSGVAATLALGVVSGGVPSPGDDSDGSRAFVVTTSGVNTATAVFALFALVALGTPRTGVLVALERAEVPMAVPELLAAIAVAAVASTLLVPVLGDRYLQTVGRLDPTLLSISALALLVVLSAVFAGPIGVAAFGAATLVGHVPPRFGARRVSLMGVLLVPLTL
jgi:putative membrane protein